MFNLINLMHLFKIKNKIILLIVLILILQSKVSLASYSANVALAGFAYSGNADTISERFPYSHKYENLKKAKGNSIGKDLFDSFARIENKKINVVSQIDELKGKDQALAVALVVGNEVVSLEKFDQNIHKIMVLIRGQAMFFDFKSMTVVRSYPISFAYVDVLDHPPSEEEIINRITLVYEGANGKLGILDRFKNIVINADLPQTVSRFLQVTSVRIKDDALAKFPPYARSSPENAEIWIADILGEAISSRTGVPIVPFSKGYAIGNVMSMRVSDGAVWELKLPKPDYEITAEISNLKKIKFSEVEGGATSFVYGAYSSIKILEPLTQNIYLDTELKNGESRVFPASLKYVDDHPNYYDAINGMFVKLANIFNGSSDDKWIRSAASAKDINRQIEKTKELIKLCK